MLNSDMNMSVLVSRRNASRIVQHYLSFHIYCEEDASSFKVGITVVYIALVLLLDYIFTSTDRNNKKKNEGVERKKISLLSRNATKTYRY